MVKKASRCLRIVATILLALLLAPATVQAEVSKKGSFAKCTNGGAACDNVVAHGLGETPKAIIFWTNGKINESFSGNFRFGFGVTDGTNSRSTASASQDDQLRPDASRGMAAKALTIVEWSETTLAAADLFSWDATNFTLRWTTNIDVAYVIHFIAIGGGEVSARVVDWQMPTSPNPAFPVDTIGFKPDVVLHAHAGDSFVGALSTNAIKDGAFGLGVMAAAGDQWATGHFTVDGASNTADADTQRGQQTDSCIFAFDNALAVTKEASFVSMDTNGFTLNFTTANGNASRIFSLALKGVSARAGNFNKTTAAQPASQTVADTGFRPDLVLLTSFQDEARATPVANSHFGIGASDLTLEGSSAFQDTDAGAKSVVDGIDKTSKVFVKVNNSTPAVDAEADLTGFFNGGFTLDWTTNDGVATQILYLALGQQSEAKVLSGSYTGNSTGPGNNDNRAIDVGFVPDFVIVKSDTAQMGVFRTSTMVGDNAKEAAGATVLTANLIQSFDAVGGGRFIVGDNVAVNSDTVMYRWIAFKAGPGKMAVGTYSGNGNPAGQAITGLGFSPELVFVISEGTVKAIHRSSANPSAYDFQWSTGATEWVKTLDEDGFTLGNDVAVVNASSTVYHYVAWNEVPGYMNVGTYLGNGPADQDVPTGFAPEYVIINSTTTVDDTVHRPASLASPDVDSTLYFRARAIQFTAIKALLPDGFRVGDAGVANASGVTFTYYAWKRESRPAIVTGYYTGTGAALQIDQMVFNPDFVIVKQSTGATGRIAVARANTAMANGKEMTGATALTAQTITALTATGGGFTVGTSALVNTSGVDYHFIAFKAAPGTMKVGRYQGNSGNPGPNSIRDIGFSPELVFIFSEGAQTPVHYSSGNTAEFYDFANNAGTAAAGVITLDADGFTLLDDDTSVNLSGTWYNYVAWNEIPGEMDIGTYVGDSTQDNRNITGVGFEPEYVIVRHSNAFYTVHHPASLGRSTDLSLHFDPASGISPLANEIQALQPDGFQVGTSGRVNGTGVTYIYYAWKRPYVTLTAVRLTAFDATRYDRGVLLNWKTGYEIDNLGFHVYRQRGGARTRVTRSMIAGSGLMAGQGTAVNAEQQYATWDLDAASADPSALYWLEDLDFNGTSTWNGPFTPVDGGLQAPPDVPTSTALSELGRRSKRRGKLFHERGARLERVRPSDRQGRATTTPDVPTQRALAGQAAIKIGVDHPGWYRVTQPELVAAGLSPQVDPQTLRLFADGVEQAIAVAGARDGRFDAADYLEFYGTGLDTPYTDTHVYWLTAGGRPGRRILGHEAPARGTRTTGASTFSFTLQQKERSIYFAALRNGDAENWFGAFISEEPSDLTFDVSNLDPAAGAAELEVVLQGVSIAADLDPDHRVAVLVNGTEVGEVVFDGQSQGVQTFALPAGTLVEGANTVTVVSRGGETDFSLVDVVRLRYPHTYRADADLLRFTADGPGSVTVSGFASSAIRVIDITDPLVPEEVRGGVGAESGLWSVTARVPGPGSRTLLAFTDATVATPAFVRANAMSQWHAAANSADYLAVTHAQFAGRLTPLLARRTQNGLTVAHVDIEDVYDEFSFGEKTPYALKAFVTHARANWTRAPRFLLLVGDATIDPRDYSGFGDADFVPTKQIALADVALETASDEWFADANDDGLPELAVGRLPVRSAEQTDVMVAKVLEYEDGDGTGWTSHVLLVAGENDETADFAQSTRELQRLVPSRFTVRQVLSGTAGVEAARVQLLDAVNQGQLIVNYIGHGSVRVWGREALLTTDDVAATWRNGSRLPLVVAMNCLNGFFHGIYDEESLAETLLRTSGGGAVAAWASSGVTDTTTQARVNQELYRLLFTDPSVTIGQAAIAAKRVVSDRDIRRSWIFFGDPALRLKGIQTPVDPATDSSKAPAAPTGASSTADSEAAKPATVPSAPGVRLSDWNGDGRDDVLLHATSGWRAIFSVPKGERVQGGHWHAAWDVYPADLNGDRVEDMVLVDRATGTMVQAINDGAGNFDYTDGLLGHDWQLQVADLNGDRIDDLLLTMPDFGFWYTLLNEGLNDGHFTYRAGSWLAASSITLGDFNGDRRADAFLYDPERGAWTLAFSDGAGDFTYASGQWTAGWTVQRANVDGDPRADLLLYHPDTGAWAEWASQEGGHFRVRGGVWNAGLTVRAIDAKHHGRDDVLLYNANSGEWTFVMREQGDTKSLNGIWPPQLTIATGDLNGDGRTDLLLYDPGTGVWRRGFRNKAGAFDFTSGQWASGWSLALAP